MNKTLKDIEGNPVTIDPSNLPTASSEIRGTVMIGEGLDVDENGMVSVTNTGGTITVGQSAPNASSTGYKIGDWVIDTKAMYAYMCYIPASLSQGIFTGSSWIKIPYEKYTGSMQQQSYVNNND